MTLEELRKLYGSAPAAEASPPLEDNGGLTALRQRFQVAPAMVDPAVLNRGALISDPEPDLSALEGPGLRRVMANQAIGLGKNIVNFPASEATAGLQQGAKDVASTINQNAAYMDKQFPKTLGAVDRALGVTTEAMDADNFRAKLQRDQFDKIYKDNLAAEVSRGVGQGLMTLPIIGGAGALVRGVGNKIGLPGIVNYLTGGSDVFGSGVAGATSAGTLGTALTAAQSDAPLADQLKQGAATSAVVGAGLGAPGVAYNALRALYRTARTGTPAGQAAMANEIVTNRSANPLVVDTSEIVPGSPRTLADATDDPNIAALQKGMRGSKQYDVEFTAIENAQNEAARSFYKTHAGTPDTLDALQAAREAQRNANVAPLWQPGQTVNPAPVVADIDAILQGPEGKRTITKTTLENIRKQFIEPGPNGSQQLVTDPQQLYESARKEIGDILEKRLEQQGVSNTKALPVDVHLQNLRDKLDDVIEQGAPGFKNYMTEYANASGPIDAQRWLQRKMPDLTDANGNFTLSKIKNFRDDVEQMRAQPGVNPAKTLNKDQLDMLDRIHQDLQNKSKIYNSVKAYGSDTQPNLLMQHILEGLTGVQHGLDPRFLGSVGGSLAGHVLGDSGIAATLGGIGGYGTGAILQRGLASRESAVRDALMDLIANPSKYQPAARAGANASWLGPPATPNALTRSLIPLGVGASAPQLNPSSVGTEANALLEAGRARARVPGL